MTLNLHTYDNKMSSSSKQRILNHVVGVASPATPRPPSDIALELQRTMLQMKGEYMTEDGKGVNYDMLTHSELFDRYQCLTRELNQCSPSHLDEDERKAFFINVYNALTIHGLATAEQLPRSVLDVSNFWKLTCYSIGGMIFSLDDIEHGVLRGNKPHPAAKEPPFPEGDPRRALAMKSCDPRIHFALVCGAKSCPSIQVYSAKNLDRGLNAAAKNFCSQEVRVNIVARRVSLSKIFEWYATDFGANERELLKWLTTHLQGESKSGLEQLLTSSDPINTESTEYNWNLNKL